jgi:hypothetical protein
MAIIKLYLATYAKILMLMTFGFILGWALSALPKRRKTRIDEDEDIEGGRYE